MIVERAARRERRKHRRKAFWIRVATVARARGSGVVVGCRVVPFEHVFEARLLLHALLIELGESAGRPRLH